MCDTKLACGQTGSPEPVTRFGHHKNKALGPLGLQVYQHSIPAYLHL